MTCATIHTLRRIEPKKYKFIRYILPLTTAVKYTIFVPAGIAAEFKFVNNTQRSLANPPVSSRVKIRFILVPTSLGLKLPYLQKERKLCPLLSLKIFRQQIFLLQQKACQWDYIVRFYNSQKFSIKGNCSHFLLLNRLNQESIKFQLNFTP